MIWGANRGGARYFLFFIPFCASPGAHWASSTMGRRGCPQEESGQGLALNTHLLLVPRLKLKCSLYCIWIFVSRDRKAAKKQSESPARPSEKERKLEEKKRKVSESSESPSPKRRKSGSQDKQVVRMAGRYVVITYTIYQCRWEP